MPATRPDHAFWDASALVLLVVGQRSSRSARALRRAAGAMTVWWGSGVEIASALGRLTREGALAPAESARATAKLDLILAGAAEVAPTDEVRDHAARLCQDHPLRAGDALQLAAAIASTNGRPARRVFVCFDRRLADVARAVGFDVRP